MSVNARKLKSGCDFSFPSHTCIPPQKSSSLISFYCPKSLLPYLIFLAASDQKSSPSFSTPFPLSLFFFLSSSFASTRQPSLSHQHNIFLSKEEIKGLTLKFQFQIVGVSNQNFICLFLLP